METHTIIVIILIKLNINIRFFSGFKCALIPITRRLYK
jgi:hypothetical protein